MKPRWRSWHDCCKDVDDKGGASRSADPPSFSDAMTHHDHSDTDMSFSSRLTRLIGGRWTSLVLVVLAVAWTGYRVQGMRNAAAEILAEAQRLQREERALRGKVDAYEAGFLRRPTGPGAIGPVFLQGFEWVSDTDQVALRWREPADGLYLVVNRGCPRSREAAALALEASRAKERQVILLDSGAAAGVEWLQHFEHAPRQRLRVIRPEAGWWSIGAPYGVTPVWFAVENDRFVGVGVGTGDLAKFDFDQPHSSKSVSDPIKMPNSSDFSSFATASDDATPRLKEEAASLNNQKPKGR